MADKITKFEDYKKRGNSDDIDIEIVDPYNFFTEEEREEYFRERQKQQQEQRRQEAIEKAVRPEISHEESSGHKEGRKELTDSDPEKTGPIRKHYYEKAEPEEPEDDYPDEEDYPEDEEYDDEEYDEEYSEDEDYDEDEDDEESEGKDLMLVVVRFASILTGIVILAAIVFGAYKFIGPKLRPDPDEEPAEEVAVALPEGYEETGDMVTVTAVSLNLRTVPSSESDATIVTAVAKGTSLKRIAQSSTDTWAIVEYEGQQLYASSKYLAAP